MSDQDSGSDPYAAVIADLIRKREEIENAIRVIEAVRGSSPSASTAQTAAATEETADMRGRYLGMSISEAAKLLLRTRRRTMNSNEIAAGLREGGVTFTSADAGNTVGSVLTRRFHATGDIVRVSRGQWGLKEWYPNKNFKKKDENSKDSSEETEQAPEGSEQQNDVGSAA